MHRKYSRGQNQVLGVLAFFALMALCFSGCGGGVGKGDTPDTGPLAVGDWGGRAVISGGSGAIIPATLTVTSSGAQLSISCQGPVQVNGAIVLDSSGHFVATGTSTPCCTPVTVPTRFEGTVRNHVITLTLTNTDTNASLGTYTLTLGQSSPAQNIACPG